MIFHCHWFVLLGLLQAIAEVDPCSQNTQLTGGTIISNVSFSGTVENLTGTASPYVVEAWSAGDATDQDFDLTIFGTDTNNNPTAAFKAEWNGAAFLSRVGLHMDEGKSYTQYQNIKAQYKYTRKPYECTQVDPENIGACVNGGVGGDYSYIGVYGWSKNPSSSLVEYYIVDDWFGNPWSDPATVDSTNVGEGTICWDVAEGGECFKGQITVDGSLYNVYKHAANGATIENPQGQTDFTQYFSVRVNPRKCGTISVAEHFKWWESFGMPMGTDLYEVKLITQVGGGIGWINYTYGTVEANLPPVCSQGDDHYEPPSGGGTCVLKPCADRRKNTVNSNLPCGSADCYWDVNAASNTKCTSCTNTDHYDNSNMQCVLKDCGSRKKNSVVPNLPCGTSDCYWDKTDATVTDKCTPCTDSDRYVAKEDDRTCQLKPDDDSASSIAVAKAVLLLLTVLWLTFGM